ncbi:hypothetical protein V6N13_048080 [Hibiscus sabdariffa]|uniref:Uncharacterized protein n=2 Tax=Hibiscus sabdariffa TaxID=183260 RepID=A0ABR1ZAD0_9ROSI
MNEEASQRLDSWLALHLGLPSRTQEPLQPEFPSFWDDFSGNASSTVEHPWGGFKATKNGIPHDSNPRTNSWNSSFCNSLWLPNEQNTTDPGSNWLNQLAHLLSSCSVFVSGKQGPDKKKSASQVLCQHSQGMIPRFRDKS